MKKNVFYVYDNNLIEACSKIPNIKQRNVYVNSLIFAYKLYKKFKIISSEAASEETIRTFHTSDYIEFLKEADGCRDLEKLEQDQNVEEFNLGYDCPIFYGIFNFVQIISGGTMTAVKQLVLNRKEKVFKVEKTIVEKPRSYLKFKQLKHTELKPEKAADTNERDTKLDEENVRIVINWQGGWHHAQSDAAEGFCYVNDIVLAILYLLKYFQKVLYIDLDIHHGNGVENAFSCSSKVMTWSIHKKDIGFYPCSGDVNDIGICKGEYFTVNCPLKDGASDKTYIYVFDSVLEKIRQKFSFECIVLQCGADSLAGDSLGGFNLSSVGLGKCVKKILDLDVPTLVLGGGGYNTVNTAKYWTYLTSLIVGQEIPEDIPDSYQFFDEFGPDFSLQVMPTLRKDCNTSEYVEEMLLCVLKNLDNLPDK